MLANLKSLLSANLESIQTVTIDELRNLRSQCTHAEGEVSFARRITQGRLDIVGHEVRRRAGDEVEPMLDGMLFDIPDILSDRKSSPGKGKRPTAVTEPGETALLLTDQLNTIVSPTDLANVNKVSDSELRQLVTALRNFETELSTNRRQLHERLDTIQGEIVRRYRDGEASVDTLLE